MPKFKNVQPPRKSGSYNRSEEVDKILAAFDAGSPGVAVECESQEDANALYKRFMTSYMRKRGFRAQKRGVNVTIWKGE